MFVSEIKEKMVWENFLVTKKYSLFVQSWQYGEFYRKNGEQFWIFGIYNDEKELIGGSLVVSTHAKRGNFLYLPYGPVLPENNKIDAFKIFTKYLSDFAKKENSYQFIRVSPFLEPTNENLTMFKDSGFRDAPMHILAENTWILDLTPSEDDLLQAMNKNHRNLIRRCMRDGIKIETSNNKKELDKFRSLYDETAKRHKFHKFSKEYIENEFDVFASNNQASIFNAWLPDGRHDASAIIMYYSNMAAYRHGASLNLDHKTPTSYLIQWEAIKEAKKRGMKWYNFWGIAPNDSGKNHPFFGITHFKRGFGGFQKDLIHCQDLPLSSRYWINWTVETIRRVKRGF